MRPTVPGECRSTALPQGVAVSGTHGTLTPTKIRAWLSGWTGPESATGADAVAHTTRGGGPVPHDPSRAAGPEQRMACENAKHTPFVTITAPVATRSPQA